MQIIISTTTKTQDVSQLVINARWSGSARNAARELQVSLAASSVDTSLPVADCPLGASVQLLEGGALLFDGYIFSRERSTNGTTLDITCFDRGLYLKRNKTSKKVAGQTPESVAAALAGEYGLPLGDIAKTGVAVSRNFFGVDLYSILMTVYILASRQTGKKYWLGFRGAQLVIREYGADTLPVIQGGSNLMDASVTESVENMVNAVEVYDTADKLVKTVENAEAVRLYGRMQEYRKQSAQDNQLSEAQKLLEDNGVTQTTTVNNLGDVRCLSGSAVTVREPYTGLSGLFWIESDIHEWKRGQYYNKLVLNLKQIMDEQTAGQEAV